MSVHWLKRFGRSQRNTAYDAEGHPAERPLQVQRFESPAMFEQLEPRLLLSAQLPGMYPELSSAGLNHQVVQLDGTSQQPPPQTGLLSVESMAALSANLPLGDFDGDNKADIMWRDPVTGRNCVWLMDGTGFDSGRPIKSAGADWYVGGIGDFNNDGKSDILWRNRADGRNSIWLMNGRTFVGSAKLPDVSNQNWKIVAVSDFNADGKDDVVWHNTATGNVHFWLLNGTTFQSAVSIGGIVDANWQVAGVGDFNNDGKPDILWRNRFSGANYAWLMNGTARTGGGALPGGVALPAETDPDWHVGSIADYTGDGKDDIWWHYTGTDVTSDVNRLWEMDGAVRVDEIVLKRVAPAWQPAELRAPIAGEYDFNSAGNADILWRDPNAGGNRVWLVYGIGSIGSVQIKVADPRWRIGGVADFNGDGKNDIFWRDRATGENVVWYMNGTTFAGAKALRSLGSAWRAAGAADFNGDGKADILWRNPTTGANVVWYMNRTAYAGSKRIKTLAGSWQVGGLGDFNNNGKTDILWRDAAAGQNRVWLMNGTAFSSGAVLPDRADDAWQVNVADYTGDGKADILWHLPGSTTSGALQVWEMDGVNFLSEIDWPPNVDPSWRLHGIGA